MEEIWKDIEGYEGIYQVSNLGRVRSLDRIVNRQNPRNGQPLSFTLKGCIMKQYLDKTGYYRLTLKVIEPFKRRTIHSLVAETFVDGYFEGAIVNHKDENKTNNRADNLEWVTYKQNSNYGNAKQRQIEKQIRPVEQLSEEGIILNTYKSVSEAAIAVGTSTSHISAAIRENKRKHAGGYRWRYKEKTS